MPAPQPSLLRLALDELISNLAEMGRETTGYRRDYAGVARTIYPWILEPDHKLPFVQIGLGDSRENEGSNVSFGDQVAGDTFRHVHEVILQVHLVPDVSVHKEPDVLTPATDVIADLFKAVMTNRTRNSGHVDTWYLRSEGGPIAEKEAIGYTVREIYGIEWDHDAAGMDTEPGV